MFVETTVGRLSVEARGEGPTVLLWPSLFLDGAMWRRQVDALSLRYRTVTVDGPGHGRSGPAPGDFSQADCAKAAFQIVDALGASEPIVVIGCSWGGIVGVEMALAEPARVAGLVLTNTPLHAYRGFERVKYSVVLKMHRLLGAKVGDGTWKTFFAEEFRRDEAGLLEVTAGFREAEPRAMNRALVQTLLRRRDLTPMLGSVRQPVLAVGGTLDGVLPVAQARGQAAMFPNGRFVEVAGAGHVVPAEKPDAFNAAMLPFLDSVTAGDRRPEPARVA